MSPALVNIDNWLRQELKKSQASFVDRHLILFGKGSVQPPKLQVNCLTAQLFQSYNSNSGYITLHCFYDDCDYVIFVMIFIVEME